MRDAMRHRGPDDEGLWAAPGAGLAHTRLSILDRSPAGCQPFASGDGRYQLVYNGELYNFRELRDELEGLGHAFHTRCDTEVVAAALAQWSTEAPARFNGMFALGWFDTQEHTLLLARDRLGIKPLFYTQTDGALAFASELNALRAGGLTPDALSMPALAAYLQYLYIPAPDTIYPGVFKLPPAHTLIWNGGDARIECYWQPRYEVDDAWTLDSAAERCREIIVDSVRLQRISDVPLGAFLSGGVDSSGVVAALARQSDAPVRTFSIGFDEPEANELEYARLAARHCGTEHHEEILRPELATCLPGIAERLGEPFGDSSALPMWLVSRMARESVTVALSGDGGDELFAGYTWTHRAIDAARYRQLPRAARRGAHAALSWLPERPGAARLRRFSGDSFLSEDAAFQRRLTCFDAEARRVLLHPDIGVIEPPDRIGAWMSAQRGLPYGERMLAADTRFYLPDDILTKVDRMTMAHGLEARVPLLDHRLVEFAATLPFHLKYHRGESKRVLKAALRPWLPPPLFVQRKRGFSLPIHRWFRGPLATLYRDTAMQEDARIRQYLRPTQAEALLHTHQSGHENHGHGLWAILMLELWLRGS
jgi:asparagine synthase (glutamine-hydrolysing)